MRERNSYRRFVVPALALCAAALAAPQLASASGGFAAELGPGVSVSRQSETGTVGFVGARAGTSLASGVSASASPQAAARSFVSRYAGRFGLADGYAGLRVARTESAGGGQTSVRLQQTYRGLPVLGGQLAVVVDRSNGVLSVLGETSPSPHAATAAAVGPADAARAAIGVVARSQHLATSDLRASRPQLRLYDPRLLDAPSPFHRARTSWVLHVRSVDGIEPVNELVVVDAEYGAVALHFDQIETALNRRICDANNTATQVPCTAPVRTEGGAPVADNHDDVNKAYDYSGDTYNFYFNRFGRDSLNNAGLTLNSTVDFCPSPADCPYANAFWDGQEMVYGDGYAAGDDVVGHELTHGVTDFTSHLFYYAQSGAINESMSDVMGEFIDLTNGAGNDSDAARWKLAEDLPGFPNGIRNIKDPTIFGDPDRMQSPNFTADPNETDEGGVHTNSGVNNKTDYLITDGDTFNGHTVSGIGIDKAARLYYTVDTAMLTSASDYADLANALRQGCANLAAAGVNGITTGDCTQVGEAVAATEMDQNPANAPTNTAPSCDPGLVGVPAFSDDLENPASGNWTMQDISGPSGWFYPQNPNPLGFDARYATSGTTNFWGYDVPDTADYAIAMANPVTVPDGGFLRFNHSYGFDDDSFDTYDGGVVEYSTDGGATWNDVGPLFDSGGYNGTISTLDVNPLAGRAGFVAESNGMGSSRANLGPLAGQGVKFRFRIGTDSIVDDFGWFIDDISIYGCKSPVPDTSIDRVKTKKAKGHKRKSKGSAKVSFSGQSQIDVGRLSFECALDKRAFKPCDSPEKLKKLKVGKHKVAVRAVDGPTAQADPSPAIKKFKIKRKKPKRHHHHHHH